MIQPLNPLNLPSSIFLKDPDMTSTTITTPAEVTTPVAAVAAAPVAPPTMTAAALGDLVRAVLIELLADHPEGFDTAEMNALVLAACPDLPKPTIRHHVWKLERRDPFVFCLKGDRIALVA